LGLFQHVNFVTWSRMVNGTLRGSVLDHVCSNNPTLLSNLKSTHPIFGDHLLISFDYLITQKNPNIVLKRDWSFYNKNKLCDLLSNIDFKWMCQMFKTFGTCLSKGFWQ
jgi:hypothetical protein